MGNLNMGEFGFDGELERFSGRNAKYSGGEDALGKPSV